MAYLDNIIIYSKIKKEYYKYVKWVLQKLTGERMPVAIKKYKFHIIKTKFCGFVMELGKLSINLRKIEAILKW